MGTEKEPIYSCKRRLNDSDYIEISTESNAKYCIHRESELEGCIEIKANTTYVNSKYNCLSCSLNYLPYFSKFYERKICQNIYAKIIKKKEINLDKYEFEEKTPAIDGKCEKNYLFTPDGINCYTCYIEEVGMPGCKGACTFSLERNNVIKCQEDCKIGYIETSEGVCQPCQSVNEGCYQCHYENSYPTHYLGVKRKRRFVCDYCEDGYINSINGKCFHCSDLGFPHCEKCKMDLNSNELICTECSNGYILNCNGNCTYCNFYQVQVNNNKCIYCNDINYDGIKGCALCERNDNKIICQVCKFGYILLTNNNT